MSNPGALFNKIQKLPLKDLRDIANSCGISKTGSKSCIADKLCALDVNANSQRVLSIDLGTKNLALCQMTSKFQVERLQLFDLGLPDSYDPKSFAHNINDFVQINLMNTAHPVLIERQRHRTGGNRAIPETILRVNFVEVLLHSYLLTRAISVHPQRVALHFSHPEGRLKKEASVNLVKTMTESATIHMQNDVWDSFISSSKKDDLADSILQATAFFQWKMAAKKFIDTFMLS